MLNQLTQANPLESSKLELIYQNGDRIIVDFMPLIDQGGVFAALADPQVFSSVELGARGRYIAWGDIDFCADSLRSPIQFKHVV